ncbi:4-alpha-N-acetylgalactosaminyltransferase [compost metagenome]
MKNYAIILISDTLGGAEQILYEVVRKFISLDSNTFEVYILKNKTNSFWNDNLPEYVRITYFDDNVMALANSLRKKQFNCVFSSQLMMNAFLGLLRTWNILKTKKLIVRESTSVFYRYSGSKLFKYKMAYWFGYRNIDLIITQTELMAKSLKDNIPYVWERSKIITVSNPFNLPSEQILAEQINSSDAFIVSAGRLIPEKGFDILLDSFAMILKEFTDLKLVILGEGALRSELEDKIHQLGISDNVVLEGYVENVYPYFKKAKMCVVSSRLEGFPNVLLQMMSQNDKVVSTTCAGGIDQIDGVELSETNNVNSLYQAMKNSLNGNTSENRGKFDKELATRSIESFVGHINEELNNE